MMTDDGFQFLLHVLFKFQEIYFSVQVASTCNTSKRQQNSFSISFRILIYCIDHIVAIETPGALF